MTRPPDTTRSSPTSSSPTSSCPAPDHSDPTPDDPTPDDAEPARDGTTSTTPTPITPAPTTPAPTTPDHTDTLRHLLADLPPLIEPIPAAVDRRLRRALDITLDIPVPTQAVPTQAGVPVTTADD